MLEAYVLEMMKQEAATIATNLNTEAAKVDAEEYTQWSYDVAQAAGVGRMPRTRYPLHKKAVVITNLAGLPEVQYGSENVFADPPAAPTLTPVTASGRVRINKGDGRWWEIEVDPSTGATREWEKTPFGWSTFDWVPKAAA
jgi:hypothetical protein